MPASSKSTFQKSYQKHKKATHARIRGFMARRPHRSFQLTRRRDYARSLKLPGFWKFTFEVHKTFRKNRKLLLGAALVNLVVTAVLIGFGSQETYSILTDTLQETGGEIFTGDWAALGEAGLLFASVASTGLTGELTEGQQIYTVLLFVFTWLTTVWLLRAILAGHTVKLRDAIYNAGAPLISTLLVSLAFLVQLIPLALAFIGYSAALASGLLNNGVEAMLFWFAAGFLGVLSLYWMTSTFFALIIVTLPGMYPIRALRTAGDMVVGRRIRILLRILWMMVLVVLTYVVVLIPLILFDSWLKSVWTAIEWLPLVPSALLVLGALSVVWAATYIYLLYRKVVEDDALPA